MNKCIQIQFYITNRDILKNIFNRHIMCKVLKVNRSLYYHWIKTGCIIKKVDKKLNKLKEIYGLIISRKRISNIMKDLNLKVQLILMIMNNQKLQCF